MNIRRQFVSVGVAVVTLVTSFLFVAAPSSTVSAAAMPPLQSVVPARLADSRPGYTTVDGKHAGFGRQKAGARTEIQIGGRGGVPADASAVVINLTSVQPSEYSFLTVYPCDSSRPNASNVNSPPYDIRANSAFVKLSSSGTICVYNEAASDFIVDVNSFVPAAGSPTSVVPARLLETRSRYSTIDGQAQGIGRRGPGSETVVQIAGRGGVPSGATAAVLNLTAVLPSGDTYLTAYPCGGPRPEPASNLNSPAGDIRANNVFVKLSAAGTVCIYTVAETDIIIDINGYVPGAGSPSSVAPVRLADSRAGERTIDGKYAGFGRPGDRSETVIQIAGRGGVPADATTALLNLTAVLPSGDTFLTVYPCGAARPDPASNLNLPARDIRANSVYVKLSTTGTVCIYTVAATDIVLDVSGYASPAATPVVPPLCANPKLLTTIPQAECTAVVALYDAAGGTGWKNKTNWLTETDPCTWYGVICVRGHVTRFELAFNNLKGTIPAEVGNLTGLTDLFLQGNYLTTLPPEFGKLINLTYVDIDSNKLAGLPNEIGNLVSLTYLDLDSNAIPDLPDSIGNLAKLATLDVRNNKLTRLPQSLGKLTKLTSLYLQSNLLEGDITAVFTPLMAANTIKTGFLGLVDNRCLTTTNAALAAWLTLKTGGSSWKSGC